MLDLNVDCVEGFHLFFVLQKWFDRIMGNQKKESLCFLLKKLSKCDVFKSMLLLLSRSL